MSGATLVLLVGRPGSGKSYLGRLIAERLGWAVVQTDVVRKELFPRPRHTGPESGVVYAEAHGRIREALGSGRSVVFDATNLRERGRRVVYGIADRAGARLVIVVAYAPEAVIRRRLEARRAGADPLDASEAGWEVYRRMGRVEPIRREHVVVNTGVGVDGAVEVIVRRASWAESTERLR